MNILVTGANGYIGQHLIPALLDEGHRVHALVRDVRRFRYAPKNHPNLEVVQADLRDDELPSGIPNDLDASYYLVHSMGQSSHRFPEIEAKCAMNFADWMQKRSAKHLIYLGGISNDEDLSSHLRSRVNVERILEGSGIPVTVLRAAIIIGSGSASFEIIRDLVEKLPVMVTPKWLTTRCQPIAIKDVIYYLKAVLAENEAMGRCWDIGGPDILTYREMLMTYARIRGLRRFILTLPVLTPRLSSHWLYFITSTSMPLARSLVESMKNEVVCGTRAIDTVINHERDSYEKALTKALSRVESNQVLSSWKDSVVSGTIRGDYLDFVHVPEKGVVKNERERLIERPLAEVRERIWSIGGQRGWYYMNWAWQFRGLLDKMVGGVGLRRGRKNAHELRIGDPLDFWRVVITDVERNRLTLFAEMKLPGEAWLEFQILHTTRGAVLRQTATFRPKGVFGRLYWYMLMPIHFFVFRGMLRGILEGTRKSRVDQRKPEQKTAYRVG